MLRPSVLVAFAILAIGSATAPAWGQPAPVIEILPVPGTDNTTSVLAISADGKTIVGYSGVYPGRTASRWKSGAFQNLGALPGFTEWSEALGISGDGSVVVGRSRGTHEARAFRWTAAGLEELPSVASVTNSRFTAAFGISDDGQVIVGESMTQLNSKHACFWNASGITTLGTLHTQGGFSQAHATSADGSVIVGWTSTDAAFDGRAFRWEEGVMKDLGSLHGQDGESYAEGVSGDGEVVVGYSSNSNGTNQKVFRWTRETNMVELPGLAPNTFGDRACDVSDDGSIVVGSSTNLTGVGGRGCVWIDGAPKTLWDLLTVDYGMDLAGLKWAEFGQIEACSADGRIFTCMAGHRMNGPQMEWVMVRVRLPRLNVDPTIASQVSEGSTQVAAAESTFLATFRGQDADEDEELTLEVTGLPAGATMTPIAGTKGPGTAAAPFLATLEWTPTAADVGSSHPVTIGFRDSFGKVVSRSFTISVRSNVKPTLQALTPQTIECVEGDHFVELSTVVTDSDLDLLTVTWKVGGVVKKTQSNVPSGTTATFGANYAHGVHSVVVEASDGFAKGTAGTTVTVQDTKDPTIVVAGDVELTTDPGKAYASKARLTPPTAQDGSGHPVTLTSDAPSQFSLGESTVVWTATDGAGHQTTATQRVVVVDEEKPVIVPSPALVLFCDPGKTFATRTLAPPKASDNVPGVKIATSAGTQFGIGVHRVLWTATDAFGNASHWVQSVTVVNRKPKANAGKNVTITTTSKRGVRRALDGSKSSDPDKHPLKYAWKATKGVRLAPGNGMKPKAVFPVGTTTVTLTVTDAGGLKHSDVVKVTVKLKSRRPRGTDADRSFAAATEQARKAVSTKRSGGAALSGLAYASAATAYGDAAGGYVAQEEDPSDIDSALAYAQLRMAQRTCGRAASQALLSAYADSGDERLVSAYGYTVYGTAYAAADLSER